MKNVSIIIALGAAFMAFTSCSKDEAAGDKTNLKTGNKLTISVGAESKTYLRELQSGIAVFWVSTDKLVVFDNNSYGATFDYASTTAAASGNFTYDNWTGDAPVVAVHAGMNLGEHSYNGSLATAYLNPNQIIYHKNNYGKNSALSIGTVTYNEGHYYVDQMKNCYALLKFSVSDETVASVSIKGNNGEILAGWVDVNYNNGNPTWAVNTLKGGSQTITATVTSSAANDGAFFTSTGYYFSVLPQTLTNGFEITLTRKDGKVAQRKITSPIQLNRSVIKEITTPIDDGLTYSTEESSSHEDIVIGFTTASVFRYNPAGTEVSLPGRKSWGDTAFDFWISGKPQYVFNGKVGNWSNTLNALGNSPVKLPSIENYYLKEVDITYSYPTDSRTFKVTDGINDLGNSVDRMRSTTDETKIDLSAYTSAGDRYLVCSGEMGARFSLTYSYRSE